ncbi:MAG: 16S rRNA (cytosine(1402)-N(4))-methyltransferase, partial [Desulfobacteraceae bacterium IS3]
MPYKHISVMKEEVLRYLNCRPGKIYADCTLGGSGHARAVLEKIMPEGLLIGMDQDRDAVENAEKVLAAYPANARIFHSNFIYLSDILSQLNIKGADGILLDLGLSLYQIEGSGRGFSFRRDEPLDMRMDTDAEMTAADLINGTDAGELERIFRDYGEERWARRIARKIVSIRKQSAITSSSQLAQIVCDAIPSRPKAGTPG